MTDHRELPLVFVGAGGFARELLGWMVRDSSWDRPVAMIQDNSDNPQFGVKVVDFESIDTPVRFILAVSAPDLKEKFARKALSRSWVPVTYIDQTTVMGLNTHIGRGAVVGPFCTISTNVIIGEFVTLNCRSGLGHESVIGDFSTLLGSNQVNGNVKVADHVLLGAGSIIHPGRSIGSAATVGIGSVVLTNVKEKSVVFGNPAKRISTWHIA